MNYEINNEARLGFYKKEGMVPPKRNFSVRGVLNVKSPNSTSEAFGFTLHLLGERGIFLVMLLWLGLSAAA